MRNIARVLCALSCIAVLLVGLQPVSASQDAAELVALDVVQEVRVSPDGKRVLYTVRDTDLQGNRYRTSLWVTNWDGSNSKRLVAHAGVQMPTWSPDGTQIAFISSDDDSSGIWVVSTDDDSPRPVRLATKGHGKISTHAHYSGLEWSPSGDRLAFAAQDLNEPQDPLVWHDWNLTEGFGEIRRRVQIWTTDLAGDEVVQVTSGDYHNGQPAWSPDGKQIAFVSNRSGYEESILYSVNENYDIWVVASAGGEPRQLTTNEGPDSMPVWSPDGKRVAYATVPYRGSHWDVTRLAAVDVRSGEIVALTDLSSFDYGVELQPGAWTAAGILYKSPVGVTSHVFLADPSRPDSAPMPILEGARVVTSVSASKDGRRIALRAEDSSNPPEVWTLEVRNGRLQKITDSNPQFDRSGLATTETLNWTSFDGMTIEGVVVKPPGFDKSNSYPLVVIPHGGPHSVCRENFDIERQYYASNGYVVLAPNIRGSVGYGQAFVDADRGQLGGGDYEDMMAGVDALIAEGYVDAERLFIAGISYGGFMTTWTVGHTDRFKAARAGAPVTNAQSFFGTTDIPAWVVWEYLGYPWENPDLIRSYSPITYVQNVSTPTLILHGEKDVRVPLSQGLEFYRSLRALGVPSEMVIYPGEMHGRWKPQYQLDILQRTARWFARYDQR